MDDLARLQLENKKIRERCEQLKKVEGELKICKTQCEKATDQVNILTSDNTSLKKANNEFEEKLASSSEDNDVLLNKIDLLTNELSQSQSEHQNQIGVEEDLKKELHDRDLNITQLTAEIKVLKSKAQCAVSEKAEEIKELQRQLKEFEAKFARASHENEELNECLTNADTEVQKLSDQNAELKKKMELQASESEKKVCTFNRDLQDKNAQIENLTQKLSENTIGTDEAVAIMLENKKLRNKNKELKDNLIEALKENEELHTKNAEYEDEIKELKESLDANLKSNDELTVKNGNCEKTIQELRDTLNNAETCLAGTTAERDELFNRKTQLEEELEAVTTRNAQIEKEIRELTTQLVNVLNQKEELQRELNCMDMSKDGQNQDIEEEMTTALRYMQHTSVKLIREFQTAKQKLGDEFLRVDLDEDCSNNKK